MPWLVQWTDENAERQSRLFHQSTAATRFVCETLEKLPTTDITFETLVGYDGEAPSGEEPLCSTSL